MSILALSVHPSIMRVSIIKIVRALNVNKTYGEAHEFDSRKD